MRCILQSARVGNYGVGRTVMLLRSVTKSLYSVTMSRLNALYVMLVFYQCVTPTDFYVRHIRAPWQQRLTSFKE